MAGAASVLSACFPVPLGTYYKPLVTSQDVRYSGNECHGYSGAPVSLTLPLPEGVELTVSTRIGSGGREHEGLGLVVRALVPLGVSFQFAQADVRISSDGAPDSVFRPAWRVSGARRLGSTTVDWTSLTPVPELFGADLASPPDFSASISASFNWPDFQPSALQIDLPSFEVLQPPGGVKVIVPSAQLQLKAMQLDRVQTRNADPTINYRTAASDQLFQLVLQQCESERTDKKLPFTCGEIADMRTTDFKTEQGPLSTNGRIWVYEPAKGATLRGSFSYRFQSPIAVRWNAPALRYVGEGAERKERTFAMEDMRVYSSFQAPLTSRIVGINVPSPSESTFASFMVLLGKEQKGSYQVQLPPLRINGNAVPLEPIRLELRRLDVGLSPFNC